MRSEKRPCGCSSLPHPTVAKITTILKLFVVNEKFSQLDSDSGSLWIERLVNYFAKMTSIKMLGNSELVADVLRRDPKPISEQNVHEYGTVFET